MRRLLALLLLATGAARAEPAVIALVAEGGELRAELPDGRRLGGGALIGSVLHYDGLDLRIETARHEAQDVWLYRVSARVQGGAWQGFCAPDPDGESHGMVLPEPGGFALTCSAGAVGKCIRQGYRPWATTPAGVALAPYHAACVNLLRAAYGGEAAFTRDGMLVDVYDHIGLQQPTAEAALAFEAGWDAAGAVCLAHPRVPENGDLAAIVAAVPRLAGRTGASCDEARAASLGALLFNRSAPARE
ncbi:hypothetical protein J4558_07445 [Leptolyngbya sp. 15MV]|nr:hypothetical protein J4558_07445 [Leptolyngbya sp. 15MV]